MRLAYIIAGIISSVSALFGIFVIFSAGYIHWDNDMWFFAPLVSAMVFIVIFIELEKALRRRRVKMLTKRLGRLPSFDEWMSVQ